MNANLAPGNHNEEVEVDLDALRERLKRGIRRHAESQKSGPHG
jgi:hypothetical protein